MSEREAYIAYATFPGIGPLRFKLLVDYFGSALKAWTADEKMLLQIGLGLHLTKKLVQYRKAFSADIYEKELLSREIKIVTRIDLNFPSALLQIPDPPIALFVKGKLPDDNLPRIGVVGTRKPTVYGKHITKQLTRELTLAGLVIVSGLARGIDAVAHTTCLETGGQTIAVLGCGVDIIYPPEHKALYEEIISKGGAVVSEVPPGQTVLKGLFTSRNRIISGLSLGVVVTEGAEDSGSLITARYAAEQGREVFAVPGPITSYLSVGPTKLIKQGAKIVTGVEDVLGELHLDYAKINFQNEKLERQNVTFNENEQKIVALLTKGEMFYDEIVRLSGLQVSELGVLLSRLELSGIIQNLGNGKYGLK